MTAANPLQGTGEWLAERTGCLTGSRMADALDFTKAGKPGARRVALVKALAAERMTGIAMRNVVLPRMQYGLEREPDARARYEAQTGNLVQLAGFVAHPEIDWCGASPDGLVDADGLVEIKVPETTTHLDYIAAGVVPDQYKPQMCLQLAATRRRWCDFVSFDDRIRHIPAQLFVRRYVPTADELSHVEQVARDFLADVAALMDAVTRAEMTA
jgi:hypothetical protein